MYCLSWSELEKTGVLSTFVAPDRSLLRSELLHPSRKAERTISTIACGLVVLKSNVSYSVLRRKRSSERVSFNEIRWVFPSWPSPSNFANE